MLLPLSVDCGMVGLPAVKADSLLAPQSPPIRGRCISYTACRQATPISSWEATSPDGWSLLGRRCGWHVALRPERLYLWVDCRLMYTAPHGSSLHFGIGKDEVLRGVSQPVCSWARRRTVGGFKEKLWWNFSSTEGEKINRPTNCVKGQDEFFF